MRFLIGVLCLGLALPAQAQSALEIASGVYGSATNPDLSCENNPHKVMFMADPPHVYLEWADPRPDAYGDVRSGDVYDLRGAGDTTLTLQREGDSPLPESGQRPTWIMRLTENPVGYCWGREDWPIVRCDDQQVRCDSITPTS